MLSLPSLWTVAWAVLTLSSTMPVAQAEQLILAKSYVGQDFESGFGQSTLPLSFSHDYVPAFGA
jgi:hypothetical protein